jgi:hypothetical protein
MSIDDRLVTLLIYHYIFIFVLPYIHQALRALINQWQV